MIPILKIFGCAFLVLTINVISQAKGWRGIVPLHSTRSDVEKLLGPPPSSSADGSVLYKLSKFRSIYFIEEGEVYIVFAEKRNKEDVPCTDAVPADTVLLIKITPKKALSRSDIKLDEKKLKKFEPATPPDSGFEGYVDEEEGISFRIYEGKVEIINYFATAKDRSLCPVYYSNPKWFCNILVHR